MPLTETPGASITKSSNRVTAACLTSVKVARAGLPCALVQPGSRLSTLAWVRSASTVSRLLSLLFAGTRPLSLTGTDPLR